jgi:HPt (histidine-containing phosphotransfer) domain-containing protein
MAQDRERAARAGMNDHVGKPIVPAELFGTLLRWLKPRRPAPPAKRSDAIDGVGGGTPPALPHDSLPHDSLPDSLPGMDLPKALGNVAGNRPLLARLLRDFLQQHRDDAKSIAQALIEGDRARAQRMAHTLKGVGGALGAVALARSAEALEARLGQPSLDAGLAEPVQSAGVRHQPALVELEDLDQALEPLMAGLYSWQTSQGSRGAWTTADADTARTTRRGQDVPDTEAVRKQLARLRALLEDLDPDAVQAAEALARLWPAHERVESLVAQTSAFEFEAALKTVEQLSTQDLGH